MNFRNQTMSPFREMNKSVFGRLNLGEPIFECSSDSGLETNRAASFPNIVSRLCSDPGGFFYVFYLWRCSRIVSRSNHLVHRKARRKLSHVLHGSLPRRLLGLLHVKFKSSVRVSIPFLKHVDHSQVFIYRYVLIPLFLIPLLSVWIGYTFKTIPSRKRNTTSHLFGRQQVCTFKAVR